MNRRLPWPNGKTMNYYSTGSEIDSHQGTVGNCITMKM